MQSVESFVACGKGMQHYFLHMSLHELCAARHLASMQLDKQLEVLSDCLDIGRKNVLGFFSTLGGWNEERAKKILVKYGQKHLREFVDSYNINDPPRYLVATHQYLTILHCAQSAIILESLPSFFTCYDYLPNLVELVADSQS